MITEDYVSFETAKLLKEKGFNEPCLMCYTSDKELLLKDICARLPYGVKIWYKYYPDKITEQFATSVRLVDRKIALSRKFDKEGDWYPIEEANELLIKPYLRRKSKMTEEERSAYFKLVRIRRVKRYAGVGKTQYGNKLYNKTTWSFAFYDTPASIDYLNSIFVDFRGLIKQGLALEASEGMYNKPHKKQ